MRFRKITDVLLLHQPDDRAELVPTEYERSLSGFVLASLGASWTSSTQMPAELLLGEDVDAAVVHVLTRLRETELIGTTWAGCMLAVRLAQLEVINSERRTGKALDRPWEYL